MTPVSVPQLQDLLWTFALLPLVAVPAARLQRPGRRAAAFYLLAGIATSGTAFYAFLPIPAAAAAVAGGFYTAYLAACAVMTCQGLRRSMLRRRAQDAGWLPRAEHRLP